MVNGSRHRRSACSYVKFLILGSLYATAAFATDYHIGPGQAYTQIGQVPWYALQAGDTVYIHYQSTPYREKFLISGRGTPSAWIRVLGVPGPNGELPIISGNNATTSSNMHWRWQTPNLVQWDGVISVAVRADDASGTAPLPAYIEIANLQVQDGFSTYSFTAENGTKSAYEGFAACIYARSAQHLLIRNNVLTNCGQGFYNWTGSGSNWWDGLQTDTVLRGNYFYNNGNPNSYTEHQAYSESDGVIYEYNRFGPQRTGALGSQLKDRSAGTVIRYNYIEQSADGWDIDLVEPQESWAALGSKASYKQAFVYGNIIVNRGNGQPNMVHWNEDHQMNQGRATLAGAKLFFYNNTIVTVANLSDMGYAASYTLFNQTWGAYECPTKALPGVVDVRNNIFVSIPRTAGSAVPPVKFSYCSNERYDLGKNWITQGWLPGTSSLITGATNIISPTSNDAGFVNAAGNDFHLLAGSSAAGIAGALAPETLSNSLGLVLTPSQQYVYHTQVTSRPSQGTVDMGAFDVTTTSGCSFVVSPLSATPGAAATSGAVSVTTGSSCSWGASSNASWITVLTTSGAGNANVGYSVAANTATTSRTGTFTVAGQTVTVTQAAAAATCTYAISPASLSAPAAGTTGSITVTSASGCAWTAVSNAAWITVTSGASGSGNGAVGYSVTQNTSTTSRTGSVTVGGQTFTVTQAAAACTYGISAVSASVAAAATTGSLTVTAGTGCTWTAVSNATWITVTAGGSGSGNGSVGYSVGQNTTTAARTGTVTVAGQTFTVTQAAATSCTYSTSLAGVSVAATGGTGSVTVTAGTGCTWTAVSGASWIVVTAGASGTGNGTVGYSVAANSSTTSRTGTVTVAGKSFTVTQAGVVATCTYSLPSTSISVAAAASSLNLPVTCLTGCTWTSASSASWVTVSSGANGSGSGSVGLSISANTATTARTGGIVVAGINVNITQAGASSAPSGGSGSTTGAGTVTFRQGANNYLGTVDRTISSMYAKQSWNGGLGLTDPAGNDFEFKNDSEYEARPIIRFGGITIPPGKRVATAKLTITLTNWQMTNPVLTGYYVTTGWNGTTTSTVNWKNSNTGVVWGAPGASGLGTDILADRTFTITGITTNGKQVKTIDLDPVMVQAWIDNPGYNNGIQLRVSAVSGYMTGASSKSSPVNDRPMLTITYQ